MQPTTHLHTAKDERVFVFGSNQRGIHGAGAAYYAASKLGARQGIGEGLTGRAYALPTCIRPAMPMTLSDVGAAIGRFIEFARSTPETRYFVSEVGCGLAGFEPCDIAPFFADAPENCDLPPGWRK